MKRIFAFFLFGILLSACNNSYNPDIKFYSSSIHIMNFPDILFSRTGFNSVDWSKEYNFEKLNRKIYNRMTGRGVAKLLIVYDDSDECKKYVFCKSFTQTDIEILIYLNRIDKYGHKTSKKLSQGKISITEALKYKSYSYWKKQNDIEKRAKNRLIKCWLSN